LLANFYNLCYLRNVQQRAFSKNCVTSFVGSDASFCRGSFYWERGLQLVHFVSSARALAWFRYSLGGVQNLIAESWCPRLARLSGEWCSCSWHLWIFTRLICEKTNLANWNRRALALTPLTNSWKPTFEDSGSAGSLRFCQRSKGSIFWRH